MTIDLDPQTEQMIDHEITIGHFTDRAQVVKHAIERMVDDQSWSDEEKAELDRRYDEAMNDFAQGRGIPGDKVREILAQRRLAPVG